MPDWIAFWRCEKHEGRVQRLWLPRRVRCPHRRRKLPVAMFQSAGSRAAEVWNSTFLMRVLTHLSHLACRQSTPGALKAPTMSLKSYTCSTAYTPFHSSLAHSKSTAADRRLRHVTGRQTDRHGRQMWQKTIVQKQELLTSLVER
jgi:hypothetical protein